ncbi:MAG: glucose-6-phosphate dehydrogenase [Phycisphaera sp.]|nr:glucose-6-phosphate dehydrogenase [Phycisphaera sp.]
MSNELTKVEPCTLVIFGASGDLTKRKLVPALYESFRAGNLPKEFVVLGVSRSDIGDDGFRDKALPFCKKQPGHTDETWAAFSGHLRYCAADATAEGDWGGLVEAIERVGTEFNTGKNLLFYLSMAPQLYEPVIENIGKTGLVMDAKRFCEPDENPPWQRIVVEKPFGDDLESAEHLNRVLGRVFDEEQIYRIDHYLGKETVQNLMAFRFANAIFEPLWNRVYVDHVQITAVETVGVEQRGAFYESAGAMRDMIQSHLLNLMAAVAMEAPNSFKAADLRNEQRKVLEAVREIDPGHIADSAVRAQYASGEVDGKTVANYVEEPGVSKTSNTETYAALKVYVDNWRWKGVPFYLRTGKAMKRKLTQIVIYFKPTPHTLFVQERGERPPNRLTINVQPDEGISLRFDGKVPGQGLKLKSAIMDFDYLDQFGGQIADAYTHLLIDAMTGDRSLFKERSEIEAAWRIVMPVLNHWAALPRKGMHTYAAGSWGPEAAEDLYAGKGHWHNPEGQSTRFINT